jgi:hypothetical protein
MFPCRRAYVSEPVCGTRSRVASIDAPPAADLSQAQGYSDCFIYYKVLAHLRYILLTDLLESFARRLCTFLRTGSIVWKPQWYLMLPQLIYLLGINCQLRGLVLTHIRLVLSLSSRLVSRVKIASSAIL